MRCLTWTPVLLSLIVLVNLFQPQEQQQTPDCLDFCLDFLWLTQTISICTPTYSRFLHAMTSYQHLAGKLSPHLVYLGNWDRKRKKNKCKSDNNVGTRLWSTVRLPNHPLSFPHWSKPARLADTTKQKAEQPEDTETCHQKKPHSSLICSDIPMQLTTNKDKERSKKIIFIITYYMKEKVYASCPSNSPTLP